MCIVFGIKEYDDYFMYKKDCTRLWEVSSIQKCIAAMWCITYGAPTDAVDNYLVMSETTCFDIVYKFFQVVVSIYGPTYLRAPNEEDTT
jgi:hypothetical protein